MVVHASLGVLRNGEVKPTMVNPTTDIFPRVHFQTRSKVKLKEEQPILYVKILKQPLTLKRCNLIATIPPSIHLTIVDDSRFSLNGEIRSYGYQSDKQ
jgi:hypothetical protein